MGCYIRNIISNVQLSKDIKELIPEASMRRRMGRVLKMAVSTGIECMGNMDALSSVDAIITSTGWGCLADSEKFLRNIIVNKEELLNPTPFIQSTFNTVGGILALLSKNNAYNITYVNRTHSFADALLDAYLSIKSREMSNVLVGAFDERTSSLETIMQRMGVYKDKECAEGAVFTNLSSQNTGDALAELVSVDFPKVKLSKEACKDRYISLEEAELMYVVEDNMDRLYPVVCGEYLLEAVERIKGGVKEVVLYMQFWNDSPIVLVLRCI